MSELKVAPRLNKIEYFHFKLNEKNCLQAIGHYSLCDGVSVQGPDSHSLSHNWRLSSQSKIFLLYSLYQLKPILCQVRH